MVFQWGKTNIIFKMLIKFFKIKNIKKQFFIDVIKKVEKNVEKRLEILMFMAYIIRESGAGECVLTVGFGF